MLIFFLVWFVTHSEQNGLQQLVHSFVHVGWLTFIITSEAKKKKEKKNFLKKHRVTQGLTIFFI